MEAIQQNSGSESWLVALVRNRMAESSASARTRVSQLRATAPADSADELANKLIQDGALWAAVVGAGVGALDTIPAIGQFIAIGSVLPEVAYLCKLQFDLALTIAAVYEADFTPEQLEPALLACLVYSLGHDFVKEILKEAGVKLTKRAIEKLLAGASLTTLTRIGRTVGLRITKSGLLKRVPLVAIPINAGLNYAGLDVFGHAAKHYFSPHWTGCGRCGHLQPRRNRHCAQCGTAANSDDHRQ